MNVTKYYISLIWFRDTVVLRNLIFLESETNKYLSTGFLCIWCSLQYVKQQYQSTYEIKYHNHDL